MNVIFGFFAGVFLTMCLVDASPRVITIWTKYSTIRLICAIVLLVLACI